MLIAAIFATSVQAQSGTKSRSGSGTTSSASMEKKKMRMMAKEEAKFARQFVKTDLAGIKLNKSQKDKLGELIHARFEKIQQFNMQVAKAIPAASTKDLMRAYKKATKNGESKTEAMASSMKMVGVSEMIQKKVLMLNDSQTELLTEIRDEMTNVLDEDQLKMLAKTDKEAMGEKAAMGDKEASDKKMGGKEKAMSGDAKVSMSQRK